jgi:biopolymer transport protein ExbD
MIDVLLVLIIIFMVIAPTKSRGLNTLVPQNAANDATPTPPSHDIVITVRGGDQVSLNQEDMDVAHLQQRLMKLFASAPKDVVFVRGEKDLAFGEVAQVIDIARGAGVRRVGLMTR